MNLPSGLWGGLGVDYIFAFLSVGWIRGGLYFCILVYGVDLGWITFLHSCLWGGLHFCILVCGVDLGWITFLHSGLWGGFGVDYT